VSNDIAVVETIVGISLVFFLPGFAASKAVFPEWRVRGPDPLGHALRLVTLSFVLSVAITVVVGFALLNLSPDGFSSTWSNPLLEIALVAITGVALTVAWIRGAFRKGRGVEAERPEAGNAGSWELMRELEALERERHQLERKRRATDSDSPQAAELDRAIAAVRGRSDSLRRTREAEFVD